MKTLLRLAMAAIAAFVLVAATPVAPPTDLTPRQVAGGDFPGGG